ncbi:syntaxin-7 [Ostrinia furnacalis]|uniref:syntaxin-7 n=1 Tax=Ostrinia furnacalis TaxID=93504 RepID=UPI00103CA5B1|nr:syntaxin-7 [Ostrinia furnacalis]
METSYQGGVVQEEASDNFQRLSSTIASNIKKISQNVSSMSKMVNQLQTPQDSHELRNQLRQIQNYTQKLVKDTSAMLMELMRMPADGAASRLTRERLSDEYMATLNAFQTTQRTAAQKTKDDVKKVKAQSINIGDPFAISIRKKERKKHLLRSYAGLLEIRRVLWLNFMCYLQSDIKDVNQIFKELGQIIHDQGAVVDSIESCVEYASQDVEAATQELRQAATYKNKLRKKKVYIAIVVAIIICIILILAFHH